MANELCECGCGFEADTILSYPDMKLNGARYRLACSDGTILARIRARRMASGQARFVADPHCPRGYVAPIVDGIRYVNPLDLPKAAATCASCSSPATCDRWCAYCGVRGGQKHKLLMDEAEIIAKMQTYPSRREREATLRLAAADRREAKRPTATDRQNAKAHPWELDE